MDVDRIIGHPDGDHVVIWRSDSESLWCQRRYDHLCGGLYEHLLSWHSVYTAYAGAEYLYYRTGKNMDQYAECRGRCCDEYFTRCSADQ